MFKKRWLNLILAFIMVFTAVFFSTGCEKTFTVTFEGGAQDAILDSGREIQKVNNSSQIKEPVYIREGYNFVGWDRSISMIKESTTVKAQWREYQFQVIFQANGGRTENNEEEVALTVDSAFELKEKQPNFIKTGYELSWDKDLSRITSSCTVNAVWTQKKYDLEFLDKDGLPFTNNKMQATYNEVLGDITVVAPEVSGKRFAYWTEGTSADALSIDKGVVWREDKGVVFYPNYVDEDEFVITYDLDGGERGQRTYSYSADMSEEQNVLFDAERVGYNFEGWLINDSQTPKSSDRITINDFKVNGEYRDVTLKAVWGNRPYVIDYDAQGGVITGETNKQVTYNQPIGTLPTAQKDGYVFVGWYYGGKLLTEQDLWKYPKDATLTAKYLAEFKVKFSLSTLVEINGAIIDCKVVSLGSVSQTTDLQSVELTIIEGQSLYTAFGFTKMPTVKPIEQAGKTEYEFGGYWKWIDGSGNELQIDSTTVFSLNTFADVQGGETILLVPHCRKIWSPNA